jgi:hypothetical protein
VLKVLCRWNYYTGMLNGARKLPAAKSRIKSASTKDFHNNSGSLGSTMRIGHTSAAKPITPNHKERIFLNYVEAH